MTEYRTAQRTAKDLCQAIQNLISHDRPDLSPFPYSRWNDDTSVWWLGKRGKGPRYRDPKLFFDFDRRPGATSTLTTGYLVEKGAGPSAKLVLTSAGAKQEWKHLLMDESWHFFSALDDMASGGWSSTLGALSRKTPAFCRVVAEQIQPGVKGKPKCDEVAFQVEGESLRNISAPSLHLGRLNGVERVAGLSELAQALRDFPEYDWTWINLWFWIPVYSIPDEASLDEARAEESRLTDDIIRPLLAHV